MPVGVRVLEDDPVSFHYAVTRGETLLVRDPEAWPSSVSAGGTPASTSRRCARRLLRDYPGRLREGLKNPAFAESYREYLKIRGNSSDDPLLREIRRAGR